MLETLEDQLRDQRENFMRGLLEYENIERKNINRIKKKWNFYEKRLCQDRGVWEIENIDPKIRFKIDKAEDSLRRRMRLRRDQKADTRRYISAAAFQEMMKKSPKKTQKTVEEALLDGSYSRPRADSSDSISVTSTKTEPILPSMILKKTEDSILNASRISKNDFLIPKDDGGITEKISENLDKKKSIRWKCECEKIALKGAVFGEIEINDTQIIFTPSSEERPDHSHYRFGALKNSFLKDYQKRKQWTIMSINEVHARNYHLMPTAIELFIKEDGKTYFFNLYKNKNQQELIRKIKELNPNVIAISDRFKDFQKYDYTNRWVNGLISNFEYLMILNSYAGRSYNDINQYPVFPWIIRDWDSPNIDFETKDPEAQARIFRPLDSPMGALNPERKKEAVERYDYWENLEIEPKFHYGSHYSNAASVIGYLIRLEPFTSLNMELQSGRFDQADRLFYSIKGAWNSCCNNRSDYRELVPEFFYLPDFLKNCNEVDFGITQAKKKVDHVELPAWAMTPEEFIMKHREALESDYVSQHLNEWIDLIFGYKQRGPEAIQAVNVFRSISYEGQVKITDIVDPNEQMAKLEQIAHFGQTPSQLFKAKHPSKVVNKSGDRFREYVISTEDKSSLLMHMALLSKFQQNPILYLYRESGNIHIVFKTLELYSIPYNPSSLLFDIFKWSDIKSKTTIAKLGEIPINELNPQNHFTTLCLPGNNTIHVVGGYVDNSFRLFKGTQMVQKIIYHSKSVTVVAAAYMPRTREYFIVAGSRDCKLSVWKYDVMKKTIDEKRSENNETLFGHHNEITALYIESNIGVVISGDKDGVVLIFCFASGKLLKSLYPVVQPDEYIKIIQGDENGFIVIVTNCDRIFIYTLNGQYMGSTNRYSNGPDARNIRSIRFFEKNKSLLLISLSEGELVLFDFIYMDEIANLLQNVKYLDRSEVHDSAEEVEKFLKHAPINSFMIGEDGKHMYLGYENGTVAALVKNYEECYKEFETNLKELGIEVDYP